VKLGEPETRTQFGGHPRGPAVPGRDVKPID
jgi:hypothetical protein